MRIAAGQHRCQCLLRRDPAHRKPGPRRAGQATGRDTGEKAGAMPPVSHPSSASARPGRSIAVVLRWRSPSIAAAAWRASRAAASARPRTGSLPGRCRPVERRGAASARPDRPQPARRRIRTPAQHQRQAPCDIARAAQTRNRRPARQAIPPGPPCRHRGRAPVGRRNAARRPRFPPPRRKREVQLAIAVQKRRQVQHETRTFLASSRHTASVGAPRRSSSRR